MMKHEVDYVNVNGFSLYLNFWISNKTKKKSKGVSVGWSHSEKAEFFQAPRDGSMSLFFSQTGKNNPNLTTISLNHDRLNIFAIL